MPRIVPRHCRPGEPVGTNGPGRSGPRHADGGRLPPASCGGMSHATETAARAWAIDAADVAAALATDPERGLSAPEAADRLLRYGRNELLERGKKPTWRLLLEQFTNAMIVVLMVAAVITALLGDLKDTVVILAIVVLNGIVGFVQEYRAEQALDALKAMSSPTARVVRDGETLIVPAPELVPGDLVRLDAGDIVTADLRLLEARALRINEAALTGESEPAEKTTEPLPDVPEGVLADQRNVAFNGTAVVYGRGAGIVLTTGMSTALGRVAELLQEHAGGQTPLQKRLSTLGQGAGRSRLRRLRPRLRGGSRPGRIARDDVPRRGEPGGGGDPRGAAGGRDRGPGPRGPADGAAQRAGAQAPGGRDARVGDGDLLGQDGHAHREPDARRAGLDARGRGPGGRRRVCSRRRDRARSRRRHGLRRACRRPDPGGIEPALDRLARIAAACNDATLRAPDRAGEAWTITGDPDRGRPPRLRRQAWHLRVRPRRRPSPGRGAHVRRGPSPDDHPPCRRGSHLGRVEGRPRGPRSPPRPGGPASPAHSRGGRPPLRRRGLPGPGPRRARHPGCPRGSPSVSSRDCDSPASWPWPTRRAPPRPRRSPPAERPGSPRS